MFLLKHFFYSSLIHRYSLLGPLKKGHAFAQLINITINVFFLNFQTSFISKTNIRVGTFFLINMVSVFVNSHFNFLNNLIEMILKIHR